MMGWNVLIEVAACLLLLICSSTSQNVCQEGYTLSHYNKSCYSTPVWGMSRNIINDNHWMKAADECASQQGYLLMPESTRDLTEIRVLLLRQMSVDPSFRTSTGYFDVFLGATSVAGDWIWLDNNTISTDNSLKFCSIPQPDQQCGMLRVFVSGHFCVNPVLCDNQDWDLSFHPTVLICQKIVSSIPKWCPVGWIPRPDSDHCYHFSKNYDRTNWRNAFCACRAKNSYLSSLETFEEAIWIAGWAKALENKVLLLGLTCLYPLQNWTWTDGTPLQSWDSRFWHSNGERNPSPAPGLLDPSEGNQCTGLSYLNSETSVMDPHLLQYGCVDGQTNFLCKMTNETLQGIFPDVVNKLAEQLCSK